MAQLSLLDGHGFIAPEPPDGASDEWYTPRWYWDPLNQKFGYTLDVCATSESSKCGRFFDYMADGLSQSWAGEVWWCNPPYSGIPAWASKGWEEIRGSPFGSMLLPAWTDRAWWQENVEPFRDIEPGDVRAVRRKDGSWFHAPPRPWAALTCEFGPRIPFGYPGDPDGLSKKAQQDSSKIYPVLLHFRSTL